jgi:predicted regulator of Ras-like GTPase activity (Roadblock/LC7/MglB family)
MVKTDWTIYEEDYWAITSVLKELLKNSNSQSVLLIDKTGQLIASVGIEPDFDLMSFASLCAADFEANSQLATLYHQGSDESMYLARIASSIILVVLFNKRTTLGLVRLRVKKAVEGLNTILNRLFEKLEYENEDLKEFDEEFTQALTKEIDALFSD